MDVKQKKLTLSVVLGIMVSVFFLHAKDAVMRTKETHN
jgi:hypothetical protein